MRKFLCLLLSFTLCATLFAACGSKDDNGKPRKKPVKRPKVESTDPQLSGPQEGDPIAIFDTSEGEIRVVLYPQYAPMAVENFTGLCEQGYYNETIFHRVVYGFVVQGGDASGTGHQGATIWNNNPYPVEYSSKLHHFSGALCAARSPDDETSTTSQFYFVQSLPQPMDEALRTQLTNSDIDPSVLDAYDAAGGLPYLDYTDTVFGQVYEGMNVVDKIALAATDDQDRPVDQIKIEKITLSTYSEKS